MNKFNQALLALVLTLSASVAAAAGDIAVLDVQAAILNSDIAQERLKELREQKDFKANMEEVEQLQKEHNELVAKLKKDSAVMSEEQLQAQTKRISEKRSDIEHVYRKLKAAEQELVQEVVQELGPTLQKVVNDMIKAEGLAMIIRAEATLHATNEYNITAKVTDKINQAK